MNWWPFRRAAAEQRITIVHEVPALSELAAAMRYAARRDESARRYEARLRRPDLVRAKPPKSEEVGDPVWDSWRAEHPEVVDEEAEHWKAHYEVLSGREKASDAQRREMASAYAKAQAVLGLPDLDARTFLAGTSP